MDEYDQVKKSSLKFKGDKKKKKEKRDRSQYNVPVANCGFTLDSITQQDERSEDAEAHGGWWEVTDYDHIRDSFSIEFVTGCYAKSLSNGRIVLGDPHPPGDGPDEDEIFTAIRAGVGKIAIKSGFGRYLGVDNKNRLRGLSEAVGGLETFLPVFENGRLAICAHNECFISPELDSASRLIVARAERVGPNEVLKIRVNNDPIASEKKRKESTPSSKDLGIVIEAELNNLKKTKVVDFEEARQRLKKARMEGQLHEALLDTRAKHKSDKYCK